MDLLFFYYLHQVIISVAKLLRRAIFNALLIMNGAEDTYNRWKGIDIHFGIISNSLVLIDLFLGFLFYRLGLYPVLLLKIQKSEG